MEQYIIPATSAIIVALIEALAAWERRKTKQAKADADKQAADEKAHREAQEKAREDLLVLVVQSTGASIALGEATAHALQRGYTNGDMEAALEYAKTVKHAQKDFLSKQGIHAMWE